VVGVLLGVILGALGGYAGGLVDWFITRLIDLFLGAAVVFDRAVYGDGLIAQLAQLDHCAVDHQLGRVVPAGACLTFSIREQDYILAARALGFPPSRILLRHVIPQAVPLLVWSFAAGIPVAIFAEAGLSLLGMGVRPPQPSWGNMLGEAGQYWQYFPHMFVFPRR
jgi:ABC-type dipeptide/oligopeptide/nickel transport system permease subunit